MHWYGSGFIALILYGVGGSTPISSHTIITETMNLDILAEDSQSLLTET